MITRWGVRWTLGAAMLLALAMPATANGAARSASSISYTGRNSQGLPLSFLVVATKDGPVIRTFDLSFNLVCEETGDIIGLEASFYGFDVPIEGGLFSFELVDLFSAYHWSGSITRDAAAGLMSSTLPALTPDEEAQACHSGDQAWKAAPGIGGNPARSTSSLRVRITRDASGTVHRTAAGEAG